MLKNLKEKLLVKERVCPWWLAYTFDNRIRRLFHDPDKMLKAYVKPGMTVLDIGCGMGFFSIAMAGLVGDKGRVIALDIQEKMLEVMKKRAARAGVLHRIIPHLSSEKELGLKKKVDFALSFWMVHEVPDKKSFLTQVYKILKPKGQYLVAEPKLHTSKESLNEIEDIAAGIGFRLSERPEISLSHAALFGK